MTKTTHRKNKPLRRVGIDLPDEAATRIEASAKDNMRSFRAECTRILVRFAAELPPANQPKPVYVA